MTWVSLALGLVTVILILVVTARHRKGLAQAQPWTREPAAWAGLTARLALGGALLGAGLAKVGSLQQSVDQVAQYQLLPTFGLVKFVGYALPLGEFFLGALILAGVFTRWTTALGGLLMAAYMAAIISLWARGIWMDCGCFGQSEELSAAEAKRKYVIDLVRDGLLLVSAWWLWRHPRGKFSTDNWLFPPLAAEPAAADSSQPSRDRQAKRPRPAAAAPAKKNSH